MLFTLRVVIVGGGSISADSCGKQLRPGEYRVNVCGTKKMTYEEYEVENEHEQLDALLPVSRHLDLLYYLLYISLH